MNLVFARLLSGPSLKDWSALVSHFHNFTLHESNNQILWRWTAHGQFTINSLYKWLRVWWCT